MSERIRTLDHILRTIAAFLGFMTIVLVPTAADTGLALILVVVAMSVSETAWRA